MDTRRCPMCKKLVERAPESVLPFCSPTCKLADLGRWLEGGYRIPGQPLEIENDGHDPRSILGVEDT
ncbi:MAG: DNA gyrase inhibitor YacG [Polyangiaceae bacterium]